MAVPTKDAQLVTFVAHFGSTVTASPTTYNVTAAECTALTAAGASFTTAFNAAQADGMKSKVLTAAKDAAKGALLPLLRGMYAGIQADTGVSDTLKIGLGIVVRRPPSPTPAPITEPVVTVMQVSGRTVRIRLRDAASPHRTAKPPGCVSATILSYVGATPPTSIGAWKLEGVVSKTVVDVTFPDDTAPGAQVWFTCYWLNRKSQSGPASDPVNAYLQLGAVTMVA